MIGFRPAAPAQAGAHVFRDERWLRGLIRRWAPACAGATLLGAGAAQAQAPALLCGLTAANVAGYHAAAAADPRFKRDAADPLRETFTADAIQAIWTFTTPRSPVYPAALCEQVVDKEGAMQIERRPLCEAGAAPCAKFLAEIAAREDGPGDGE